MSWDAAAALFALTGRPVADRIAAIEATAATLICDKDDRARRRKNGEPHARGRFGDADVSL